MTKTMSSVLVVEDDESMRLLLQKWMEGDGYRVDVAENGFKAFNEVFPFFASRRSPPSRPTSSCSTRRCR